MSAPSFRVGQGIRTIDELMGVITQITPRGEIYTKVIKDGHLVERGPYYPHEITALPMPNQGAESA